MTEQARRPFPVPTHWSDGTPMKDEYGNAPDPRRLRAARGEGWAKQPSREQLTHELAALVSAVDAVRWVYEAGQEPGENIRELLFEAANKARRLVRS